MRKLRRIAIAIGILPLIPALFFIEGILVGLFHSDVPRSTFYEYYWYMFPALMAPGVFCAACYLVLFWKEK